MPAVDRDAMSPVQRAAWDRLWRVLLAPEPKEETCATESLAADSDAGESADTRASTAHNDSAADRSRKHGR